MTVNYSELKCKGYILKEGDTLTLHGIHYQVVKPGSYYWLTTTGKSTGRLNDIIFHILNLDKSEFFSKLFGGMPCRGDFSIMGSAEKLTKLVIALYEQPMFHPGDKVRIAEYKEGVEYPFGFTGYMRKLSGNQYTIEEVDTSIESHSYILKGECFSWSENQLEFVSKAEESVYGIVNPDKEEKPKKDITYEDLIDGYILQEYDGVNIAGIPYRVCRGIRGNFLYVTGDAYDKIFTLLGIKEKDDFCKKFGELGSTGCRFPEFKTMEGLTKCVIELMERAEHIQVSPEPFAVSMDYGSGSSTSIIVASEPRPCSTTDTGIVRLPEIKDDFKIIIL